jgi:hypothetical protein
VAQLAVGKKRTARDRGGSLRLRLDDDAVVTVEIAGGRGALFAPRPEVRRGAWREVDDDPRAALVAEAAPGDHVAVELSGWVVPPGALRRAALITVATIASLAAATIAGGAVAAHFWLAR